MATDDKERLKAVKGLHRAQEKHTALLGEVEKARAKMDKRKRKLQMLEAKIARLERASAEPKKELGQPAANGHTVVKTDNLRRARLIYNPESGGESANDSRRLVEIVSRLREHGILAGIDLKTSGKVARDLAKAAIENGDDLVIVAGGDGTIEDVASELVGSKTTLGILPTGTMNNLARCLGIPLNIEGACALIGMGVTRRIDVGRVVSKEKAKSEYFLEAAGFGLSAIVIPAGQAVEKGQWGALPFALRKLFDSKPEPVQVELDEQEPIIASSQIVTVSNAPMMGKNMLIAPNAKMDDGLLDIAIYDGMTKTDLLQHFTAASSGQLSDDPAKVKFYHARRVRIRANQTLDEVSDKDVLQKKQLVEIEIVPQALSVIVGNGIGLSIPVEAAPTAPPLSGPQTENENNPNGTEKQVEETH
jgi:diacylglycerol kinase (ATP)